MCLFFLWIIKSDVWVTEKSQPPGGMKAVEIYIYICPTLVLKRSGWKRTFADVFILISNADGKATAAALLHLDFPPPIPAYIHPHTPLLDSAEAVAGMLLTMAGITLCVISSVDAGPGDVTHWRIIRTKDSNPFKWLLGRSRNRPKHTAGAGPKREF